MQFGIELNSLKKIFGENVENDLMNDGRQS